MDHRLGFYVFGISRARRMGIDRVLIHNKFFDILPPPPTVHAPPQNVCTVKAYCTFVLVSVAVTVNLISEAVTF